MKFISSFLIFLFTTVTASEPKHEAHGNGHGAVSTKGTSNSTNSPSGGN